MNIEPLGMLLLVGSSAVTFILARVLGRRWREKRRQRLVEEARKGESRQARRARERKAKR
jgi:uncharacterized membrane protein YdjX (TVP38/TMEM64 family)